MPIVSQLHRSKTIYQNIFTKLPNDCRNYTICKIENKFETSYEFVRQMPPIFQQGIRNTDLKKFKVEKLQFETEMYFTKIAVQIERKEVTTSKTTDQVVTNLFLKE